jgi:hypothetical protein
MLNKTSTNFFQTKWIISFLTISFFNSFSVFAQDQSFEGTNPPSNWNASIGSLSTSNLHYKLDDKSLKWDWSAGDILTVSNLQSNGLTVAEVQGYFHNMFRMWIYNTSAVENESLEIEFYDNTNTKQFHYTFNINFSGWRAASASYKNEMSGLKNSDNITTLKIKAPSTGNGTFFIDYVDYTMDRNTSRSPDYQLTFINANNEEHWGDLVYFQSLTKTVSATVPTSQELTELTNVKSKYDDFILSNSPGSSSLNTAVSAYNGQSIKYENGISSGKPLFGTDYSDANSIAVVDDFIHIFARDYKHNNRASSLTYFLNTIRYLLDQGYAEGSLVETIHHIGYRFRNVAKSVHLMKTELQNENLWDEAQKMVEWYAATDIIWHPTAHKSNMDDALTRSLPILGACLYKKTFDQNLHPDTEKVRYLKGFRNYAETWLSPFAKERNGVKVDYTGFHHHVYYPQYAFGSYKSLAQAVNYISGGDYGISSEKRETFKKILSTARVLMSENNFSNSLSGRSPFNDIAITSAYKNLGLISPVDEQLIGAYNYITGGDSQTNSYNTETLPTGFWQINFANLGVYRQNNWVADIKGFNKYFWGTEIYSSDNRYGRYQSYGAVEIMYPGGHANSGLNINGWNWNMPPGSTTIHLPWNDLVALNGRQDEKTDSDFAASLRFGEKNNYYVDSKMEGKYGLFGMDFTQKNISSSHNTSFKFKKSVFCFDGKIICLGSNISNNDNSNITATNIFQNKLNSESTPITINNTSSNTFPYSTTLNNSNNHWIIDAYNTGYFVKSGSDIVINRKSQTSPNENGKGGFTNGNFASAYINHSTSPDDASYEFVIIPKTTSSKMETFSSNMEASNTAFYEVLQKNATAHIVKYNNMHGYTLFSSGNYGSTTPIKSNDIPCLIMTEAAGNNLNLSIVNPDLNFANNYGLSQAQTVTLILNGDWSLNSSSGGNVQITAGSGETTVTIDLKDGLPVDIELYSGVYNPFYPAFYYEDFRYNNGQRGYDVQVVSNPNGQSTSNLGKVISDIVDTTDSNGEFDNARPTNRIPNNNTREQKAISIVGATSGQNFDLEVWIPMTTINLSSSNPYISSDDTYKYVSFWTESRYANGGISSLSVLISTDYTDDVNTATWTDVTSSLNQIAKNDDSNNLKYLKSTLDLTNYTSSTFTLAFKYLGNNSTYSLTNRNGTFYISDVNYYTSSSNLSTEEFTLNHDFIVYPNPVNDIINIKNLNSSVNIKNISLIDLSGRVLKTEKNSKKFNVNKFSKGMYFLQIETNSDVTVTKTILIQ